MTDWINVSEKISPITDTVRRVGEDRCRARQLAVCVVEARGGGGGGAQNRRRREQDLNYMRLQSSWLTGFVD